MGGEERGMVTKSFICSRQASVFLNCGKFTSRVNTSIFHEASFSLLF